MIKYNKKKLPSRHTTLGPEKEGQRAFYYARVLQIPTARHSLFDTIALQAGDLANGPTTIQERAYTSPIWYTP